jgi:hypothetical protein
LRIDEPNDGSQETAEDMLAVADTRTVLAEMARGRGLDRVAELGDLPPLDPETKAKYLARSTKGGRRCRLTKPS